ncbi:hypothetical protein C4D60_Mb01t00270 [Musa balbisiana]|uniref:Secreted protein n=1 Tax=Musa balbisiana TaxID=52838 RepID=A0A4S8JJJ9_MUSBA|nr:hypothetical protein C4D60_Mb01t00270 [Musa balbisiana]
MLRMLLISVIRVAIVRQAFGGGSREQSARKILPPRHTVCRLTTMCQKPIVRPSSTVQRKTRSGSLLLGCQAHEGSRKEKAAFFQSHHHRTLLDDT